MSSGASELLVFRTEDRRFAVPSAAVREVVRAVWVEALPGAPATVEGLIDYRGTPTPVYDVRARFGLPLRPLHPRDHLIVLQVDDRLAALRVDRTVALVDAVEQSTPDVAEDPLFPGVAQVGGELLLIHDPARFLDATATAQLARALEAEAER